MVWLWIAGTYAVVFAVSLALVGYGRHMFKTYRYLFPARTLFSVVCVLSIILIYISRPPREDMLNLFYKDSFRKCARKVCNYQ